MTEREALERILYESGVTQRELAELIGVSRVTVNRWLAGFSTPTPAIDRVLREVLRILDRAVEAELLPGKLPPAHSKTVEERRAYIHRIYNEARNIA